MYYTPTSVPMVPSLASLPPTLSLPSIQPYPSLSSILQTPYAPPSPILASSTPGISQHPNTRVRDIHDPQVIPHPVAQSILPTVRCSLDDNDDDSLALKPGNIFVWEEHTKSDSGGGGTRPIPRSSGHLSVPGSLSLDNASHNSDKLCLFSTIESLHAAAPSLSSQDNRSQPPRPWYHLPETAPVYTWQMSRSGGGKSASPMKKVWFQREDGGIPTTANVLLSEVCPLSKLDPAFVSMLETNYEATLQNMVRNLSLRLDCVVWQSVSPPTRKKVVRTLVHVMKLKVLKYDFFKKKTDSASYIHGLDATGVCRVTAPRRATKNSDRRCGGFLKIHRG
ncbi:hypothetical protein BDY19DRAFT_140738 [Irpex rosettiformis]|uniref:Uncharacterized protein n=1 Tax=Irpex rosettiformis TaxID=378272 RepID=A0ACB8U5E5_9APHY|nr:hypothetical protein BDY19DRAFT_140738 [Irpex rosettiformis]